MQTMHLFAGIGGGMLADLILGHEPIIAVEWDRYACDVLRERAKDGWFPGLHVWEGDVRLFDPSEYTGRVDCIHAGFPCQDISVAGKQAGVSEGTRSGLYREVLRIAGVVRPRYLFLENVAAILSNGLGTVLADLAPMGYDCRWCCIRASDVGAPHHRDRWFLLADTSGGRFSQPRQREVEFSWGAEAISAGEVLADPNIFGLQRQREGGVAGKTQKHEQGRKASGTGFADVPDPTRAKSARLGEHGGEILHEPETAGFDDSSGNWWWTNEPGLGRVANGVPNRVGQLKGYGNAQVPLQAATAWRLLGGE